MYYHGSIEDLNYVGFSPTLRYSGEILLIRNLKGFDIGRDLHESCDSDSSVHVIVLMGCQAPSRNIDIPSAIGKYGRYG